MLPALHKIESKKIINLLNDSINEQSKFATKKWYVTDDQTGREDNYSKCNSINFETNTIKSSFVIILCIYCCDRRYNGYRCCSRN